MHAFDALAAARRRIVRRANHHRFGAFGPGSSYDPVTSTISGYENFYVGRNVFIGPHAILSADRVPVVIGDDTIIGPGLCLIAGNHAFDVVGVSFRGTKEGRNSPITIGRNVWIGARVTILSGISIGDAAVIGAGAIVTRDVPSFAVAVGNPARTVRWRFEDDNRKEHEAFIERELTMPRHTAHDLKSDLA